MWVRADSRNGYFSQFEVYRGKKERRCRTPAGSSSSEELTKELQGKWHHVYFDNFFTSYSLLCDLEKSGIYGCGTARKDRRGFPREPQEGKNLRTGKIYTLHKQKLDTNNLGFIPCMAYHITSMG